MKRSHWIALGLGLLVAAGAAMAAAPACSPALDALADEAALEAALFGRSLQGPTRVGEEVRLRFASPKAAAAGFGEGPRRVWRQRLHDPGATYIAPHFSRFDLPAGAFVLVRSRDGSRLWRYTGQGKAGLGVSEGFWGIHIPGEEAIVELWALGEVAAGAVVIDSYARGFADLDAIAERGGPVPAAICGEDDSRWAQCYTGSEPVIYDKSRAALRLLIQGSSACTGWLVGDEGHVMTNNHCIGSSSAALNTDYEFMAERSCGTNCTGFGACPGTVEATSGTLIQTNSTLDYSLILLPTNVSGTYGFLQMRGSGAVVDERIYIPGHPGAWGKRISVVSGNAANDQSGFCEVFTLNASPCSGGPFTDVGYFCDTQGGSSGSPVLAYADHAVVSLHHCANCPNRGLTIQDIIADLGAKLPNNALTGGDPPPPPPPPPSCLAKGESCTLDSECCSNKCKGKVGRKSCK